MAYPNGYNYSWTEQDIQQLVDNAAQQPHTCAWVVGNACCGLPVFRHMFPTHLRDYHGITGSDRTQFQCRWVGCGAVMNKESINRHVMEMHLQTRHTCPFCRENFSRRHTLNSHIRSKHYTQ
ncbi:hypothetical protein SCLCIDRAFT_115761 [Scleroderma citrinum Foug A]|uniref:C2H2-type domain-containing protein n=1 Tax=Scleroderma citrinum Foug A TaxID=1036808 RepID=A0A0C3AH69_9AGAM|nr:hypothetical protein SCLCIDRAFT_115761 [Scleroderma citrinum Foug A]